MSAGDYPLPSNAAYIWTAGDKLFLGLPSETSVAHTVVIPLDKMIPDVGMTGLPKAHHRGFAVLIETLRQREIAGYRQKIGEPGALPRAAIENAVASDEKYTIWLEAIKGQKVQAAAAKAEANDFLKGLGLI